MLIDRLAHVIPNETMSIVLPAATALATRAGPAAAAAAAWGWLFLRPELRGTREDWWSGERVIRCILPPIDSAIHHFKLELW